MTARRFLLALVLFAPLAPAQDIAVSLPRGSFEVPSQTPGYPVTGRVVCADTQHAARFAEVTLIPAGNGGSEADHGSRSAVGRTDLDGRFTISNVPPGEYFATADLSGYVNDAPSIRRALSQGGSDPASSISGVARVQVTNGGGAVAINLQRGAVLAGTVTWDDGSPAAGVAIGVQPPPSNNPSPDATGSGFNRALLFGGLGRGSSTDDRGRFRVSGLAAGSYLLQVSLQSPLPEEPGAASRFTRTINLQVFAPNKLRRSEATVFTLGPGEERADIAMVVNLNGLHTVAGQVSSSGVTVRSGTVQVTDQNDPTLNRRGVINSDGTFAVPYVPAGTYTLRVNASSQVSAPGRGSSGDPGTRFQPLTESVTVADSDLTGLSLTVTPATTASQ